jgi:DNA repair protein RecO (recombination protein O)
MPTITDTAICLRHWEFSETSQTVSLFTRGHGIVRGLAKGSRRERGNFSGGIDVLTRGHVVALTKRGRDLATITEWHLEETFRHLRQRLDANRTALYMVDLVRSMLSDEDPHPRLFDVLALALRELADPSIISSALLQLQWAVLEETGYRPELDRDVQQGGTLPDDAPALAFDPRSGGLVASTEGTERWGVRRSTVELLRDAAGGRSIRSHDRDALDRANRLLATYCRELLGQELPTMRWAFSDLGA